MNNRVDIKGYEGLYQIDTEGNVFRLFGIVKHGAKKTRTIPFRVLKHKTTKLGYKSVHVCKDGKNKTLRIHRLLAIHFIPNPENKPDVNHKNGIKGDFSIDNLEWCTKKENIQHAVRTGLKKPSGACLMKGEAHYKSKIRKIHVGIIKEAIQNGHTPLNISKYFNITRSQVYTIKNGRNWV